ncbi:magnesium transporter CorA family protein [Lacticaseibacillus jixianensis]|uniref:Magnesium transporter CorA family protein n=1 Tax=Lacticaseibacillus jixianensis TaxID=2486012 RepID=A0ABW4B6B0_9LACO|nr:magnesium transporter CorA family protein [Lacticaseibacillus jixianensis]
MHLFTALGVKPKEKAAATALQWLSVQEATEEECHELATQYGIPVDYMTPVFNAHENPRVAGMADKSGAGLILVRCPYQTTSKNGERTYATSPLAIIIQDHLVTTVSPRKVAIHNRCVQMADHAADPVVFALSVLNLVFGQFLNDTDQLAAQTQSMEIRVGNASHNTLLYEIMAVEKSLVFFTSALQDSQAIWPALQGAAYFAAEPAHREKLAIAERTAHQAFTLAQSNLAILDQYNATVSSVVSNNLNLIMKMLTSVSIIMTIPSIIGSLWGMNTKVPWQQSLTGFWLLLFATLLFCVAAAYWLHKKDYF